MADGAHKSPRLAAHRGEYRKILREKINAEDALEEISHVEQQIKSKWESLAPAQVGALKVLLESKWRKVNKFLPDPKALEHDPGEYAEALARDQLNVRIAELYARVDSRAHGRGGEGIAGANAGSDSTH